MIEEEKKVEKITEISKKNRKWLTFVSGLFLGLLMGISIFFIDKYLFSEKMQVYNTFDHLYTPKTVVKDTIVQETKVVVYDTVAKKVLIDSNSTETPTLTEADFEEWDDVDFFIEPEEDEEVVMIERMLSNKKIEVKIKQSQEASTTPAIVSFDVQEWSTPIKNSKTYQNSAGILKIKGMDINPLEIHFVEGNYYLYNGAHYYPIKENKDFERLVAIEQPF